MPAIPASATLLHALVDRDIKNATADPLQVVCAWPVSGQYGPGSRYLYYVLVIACVLARKVEWLKRACLAAALILPAVAAIHGIVLAILHTDDAVDMDLFGAFQLCSIGILAAPVTVKLSDTYFLDRGRNIIFAWTGLILAGLLSLTVEFYRTNSVPCPEGPAGEPLVNSDPGAFPYDETFKCKLQCDIGPGNPWSPMRAWDGSTNNIYVVPAPYVLTFGTATLLAAACCLPAILSLVTMWNRIAEFNWRKRFFPTRNPEKPDDIIEGTNGATPLSMSHMNEDIKKYLKIAVELPVFGGAVLAILVIGEKNFWSRPVSYMTEPIASVGQWGSIVGTGFAVLGSMYVILARKEEEEDDAGSQVPDTKEPHADHHEGLFAQQHARPLPTVHQSRHPDSPSDGRHESSPSHEFGFSLVSTITGRSHRTFGTDAGNRRKFAGYLSKVSDYIGTPSRKRYDVSEFQQGPAMNYPEIPGETNRNEHLSHLRERWPAASIREVSSRNGSPDSHVDGENENGPHVNQTPESPQSPASDQWPTMPPRAARASTLPTTGNRSLTFGEPMSPGESRGRPRSRRDTLEVPSANHLSHVRTNLSLHSVPTIALQASEHLPAIVVSAESEPTSAVEGPNSHVQNYPHGPA
ncbi:hypothetical protein PFICI_00136 [Pestalotiopsis fici W106-1]|uniref:Uncharacterized protein n=1 Tax=Pestalotiopsis fici (strain W106-1 / CGMCC3.15140) TaxID=1229662 RepID=W3XJU7_PESFW|nr:uncharacterized protein PFICI_00136 [Pestalotiopsis fici W106-1]ETS86308.1 hypothetical protein PFICI_00136 [Pestalotiopsis fici W106-1]